MISVIIPIYNVEKYLRTCLNSIINQTFRDLEIILVDDGSSDSSYDICEEYKKSDSRIVVLHKSNLGLSEARNKGIDLAKGDWIYFLDSDDWIEIDAIDKLYKFAQLNNCDIVQGNHFYAYEEYLLYRKPSRKEKKNHILSREETMKCLIINDRIKNFAWGKLYKTNLIRDLKFPVGKYFEDSFWQHNVIDRVNRYGIIDKPLYYYRQRTDSISGQLSSIRINLLEGNHQRLEFIKQKYPSLEQLMKVQYDNLYYSIYQPKNTRFIVRNLFKRIYNRLHNQYAKIEIKS